jgi:HD-like signal output (HDOD) protein
MGLFDTIRRHAAVASGNFGVLLKDFAIPALPAAMAQLVKELRLSEPDVARLSAMIEAEPDMAVKVLKTINSPLYTLRTQVSSIRHALTLLGLERVRELVLSYAAHNALPTPPGQLFRQEAFWTDALVRALLARQLAKRTQPAFQDEVFAAMLLSDAALPVLLTQWRTYYESLVTRWRELSGRLSVLEREQFGWDHAQATAWILEHWDFPDQLVCLVGVHNLRPAQLQELGLQESAALPMTVAALLPSVLKPDPRRCQDLLAAAAERLAFPAGDCLHLIAEVRAEFASICRQFGLPEGAGVSSLDQLEVFACSEECRT